MPTVKSCIYAWFLSHAEKSCGGGEGVLIFFFCWTGVGNVPKKWGLEKKGLGKNGSGVFTLKETMRCKHVTQTLFTRFSSKSNLQELPCFILFWAVVIILFPLPRVEAERMFNKLQYEITYGNDTTLDMNMKTLRISKKLQLQKRECKLKSRVRGK